MLSRGWRRGPASLGAKLVLALTAAGVAGAIGITLLLALVITPSFHGLEGAVVEGHVERTAAVLAGFRGKVEGAAREYGDWSASYAYLGQPTRAFEQESVSAVTLRGLGVQGIAFVDRAGGVRFARWHGAAGQAVAGLRGGDLLRALGGRSSGSFYLRSGDGLTAVGVAEVRGPDGAAARGHVVMARALPGAQLAELLELKAAVVAPSAGLPGPAAIDVPVAGPDGRAVAAVRFHLRREVSLLGRRMLLLAVAGSTLLLLIVLVALRRVIARQVLAPLRRVEAHMQRVRALGSLSPLPDDERNDEIGSLGRSFNAMLRQLGDLREQLEAQSFALGRSESAVAMLHNVRNALNPVSTVLSQSLALPPPVERDLLNRALAELAGDAIPAARRLKLTGFVAAGVEGWAEARDGLRRELAVGREAMTHALEIIGQQQASAHERPALEACDLLEIVARNAAIARYAGGADIAFSYPSAAPPVLANRVILSQVIGNLFGNAAEAIAATGRGRGMISVSVEQVGEVVEVRIGDDGEGFDPAIGAALFGRGFSTRNHKSGGLGLHWCANVLTGMEGGLRLESEGPGCGATAVVTLRAPAGAVAMAEAA